MKLLLTTESDIREYWYSLLDDQKTEEGDEDDPRIQHPEVHDSMKAHELLRGLRDLRSKIGNHKRSTISVFVVIAELNRILKEHPGS